MRKLHWNLLWGTLIILGGLWVWGIVYYMMTGIDPNMSRPWTIPITIIGFYNEPLVMDKIWKAGLWPLIGSTLCLAIYLKNRVKNDLGDAKFASELDLKNAGLRAKAGLVLGKFKGKFLIDAGQTHVLVAAPTGSGKGVGIVIPNLLTWNGSAVILDIKGENHQLTSGFRQAHGHRIFVFSPFSDNSHRFNPFDAIDPDPRKRFNDIQNIATILLPDNEKDPTWSQQGRGLFVAFALYLLDTAGEVCTIGNILRHLQTQEDTRDIVKGILAKTGDSLDPSAKRSFANFAQQEKRMSESVKVGLVGALTLWNSPSIDAATSTTDFDIMSLRRSRTSIYVVVSLADMTTLRPLLKLFFEQVFAAQLRKEPQADEKHKILFLMDEFESLGTMDGVVDKLPFVRSFGIRMLAIVQGLSQLDQRYTAAGRDKILQGCKHQIFFAANDQQTTQYVSQTLGKKTISTTSKSRSKQGRTISKQSQARDLMLPQEVRELSTDKLILITEGTRPVLGDKVRYFKDKTLSNRAKQPATLVPRLDLNPKSSPSLVDITGPELAKQILNSKGVAQRESKMSAPKNSLDQGSEEDNKAQFSNLLHNLSKGSDKGKFRD